MDPDRASFSAVAAAISLALIAALFFNGVRITAFSLSMTLLVLGLAIAAVRTYGAGVPLPRTLWTAALLVFWCWLGLSILWSQVPYASTINFWWIGALPMVFLAYVLCPRGERVWPLAWPLTLAVGAALAGYAAFEAQALLERPRATFLNPNSLAALLNLLAVPAAAYLLMALERTHRRRRQIVMGAALFLFGYVVALTQSRGALLSLAAALLVLLSVNYKRVTTAHAGVVLAVVLAAFAAANLQLHGGLIARMETLSNPASAGTTRFLIWEAAWEMWKTHPWAGVGFGIFWLAYPKYRLPGDNSGGFYAHNDYLQIAIETGLPGLVLLLALMGALVWWYAGALKRQPPTDVRLEMSGLFAGVLAVAMHSFLTFNFYTLPILIVAGLMLGRLHELAPEDSARMITLHPSRWLGRPAFRVIVILAALFPISYFAGLGLSEWYFQQGRAYAAKGQLRQASAALNRAAQLFPATDNILSSHADLLRQVLDRLPDSAQADRRDLFEQAMGLLARAEERNPLRPSIFHVRGLLYQQFPGLGGENARARAIDNFRAALERDPRFYRARLAYARLLLADRALIQAHQLLEEGMAYHYPNTLQIVPYYTLTARLRMKAGDREGARSLAETIDRILSDAGVSRRFSDRLPPNRSVPPPPGSVLD